MTLDEIKARCDEEGNCWLWTQGGTGRGMPQMRYLGQTMNPRRAVLHIKNGKYPKVAVATCGNTFCCSPHCAIDGTAKQRGKYADYSNTRNAVLKGLVKRRAASPFSDEVIQAVRDSPLNAKQAAKEFGMSWTYAKSIKAGTARRDYRSPFTGLAA